jgi:hypothetical protein
MSTLKANSDGKLIATETGALTCQCCDEPLPCLECVSQFPGDDFPQITITAPTTRPTPPSGYFTHRHWFCCRRFSYTRDSMGAHTLIGVYRESTKPPDPTPVSSPFSFTDAELDDIAALFGITPCVGTVDVIVSFFRWRYSAAASSTSPRKLYPFPLESESVGVITCYTCTP